jgi:hypothetical protein
LTLRVEIDHRPGMLGRVASAIGEAGATIGAVDLVQVDRGHTIRDITVQTADSSDWPRLTSAVDAIEGACVLDTTDRTFMLHVGGKIEVQNKSPLKTREDLSMALWKICPPDPSHVVDVAVLGDSGRGRRGIRVHRTSRLDPQDIGIRQHLPVTSPARTLLDLADVLS